MRCKKKFVEVEIGLVITFQKIIIIELDIEIFERINNLLYSLVKLLIY